MTTFNIEERVEKAKRLFKEGGYNCCQAVVLAYNDIFGIDDATAAAISSGFGGGMGRMREVCGSVSGMVVLAGLIKPATDPSDKAMRTANYARSRGRIQGNERINYMQGTAWSHIMFSAGFRQYPWNSGVAGTVRQNAGILQEASL